MLLAEVGRDAFQEIKLERMFDDVAVFNQQVQTAEALPDLLNQAIKAAYTHKGVAVLTVSDDLFSQKLSVNPFIHLLFMLREKYGQRKINC